MLPTGPRFTDVAELNNNSIHKINACIDAAQYTQKRKINISADGYESIFLSQYKTIYQNGSLSKCNFTTFSI